MPIEWLVVLLLLLIGTCNGSRPPFEIAGAQRFPVPIPRQCSINVPIRHIYINVLKVRQQMFQIPEVSKLFQRLT